jgi:hypothetical protein
VVAASRLNAVGGWGPRAALHHMAGAHPLRDGRCAHGNISFGPLGFLLLAFGRFLRRRRLCLCDAMGLDAFASRSGPDLLRKSGNAVTVPLRPQARSTLSHPKPAVSSHPSVPQAPGMFQTITGIFHSFRSPSIDYRAMGRFLKRI